MGVRQNTNHEEQLQTIVKMKKVLIFSAFSFCMYASDSHAYSSEDH